MPKRAAWSSAANWHMHDAARYAFENSCGSKAACKHICDDPKKLTYNMVQPLLKQLKQSGKIADDDRDHHSQILTVARTKRVLGTKTVS